VFGALRNAIEDRYDLIHYIYSAFYQHTQTGEPIMRTMWNEYADDENVYDIYTQFMFGSDMLVAPKVTQPDDVLAAFGLMEVSYYLPTSDSWYIWNTGTKLSINGWQTVQLETEKEAKFARAGSIFPILEHQNCHSLLECIDNPI
jgi:alpha-glucosidase (family GH31 glycosyl hydrolase)